MEFEVIVFKELERRLNVILEGPPGAWEAHSQKDKIINNQSINNHMLSVLWTLIALFGRFPKNIRLTSGKGAMRGEWSEVPEYNGHQNHTRQETFGSSVLQTQKRTKEG